MLPRLRHRTIRRTHNQYRTIHLSRTRNHILHIIRMTRTINMRIMTTLRLILNMRRVNRNTTLLLLRSLVNLSIIRKRRTTRRRKYPRNRRRQRRLAMIHMTNRTYVHMRLHTLITILRHLKTPTANKTNPISRAVVALILLVMPHPGAGGGNRTRVTSLEGWGSATELHPPVSGPPRPPHGGAMRGGGGGRWIRTTVGIANGFTARPF